MKKRTIPLLLLIAGVSATALAACGHEHKYEWKYSTDGDTHWQECECGDKKNEGAHIDADSNGKCDECGASLHVHAYEWASDATNHWQECECGDKKDAAAHVDVKNNETDADGEDDKCDVCGREATVKFNMLGHGVAPAKQYVALSGGGSVIEPETPADDDCWKFKGWYKDDDCTQAFNFGADKIEAATTLYAKWEEDTTEGASKTHAFELEIGLENAQSVEKGKTLFFSFTAEKTYRYTAALGAGIPSQNSTFTTSLTGDTVYGKDQDAESVNFDLKAGETVYVLLTYQGENGEDLVASPLLIETTDEPLPADYFIDGEYAGGTYSLEIDREAGTVTYNENSYEFSYVGGAVDMLYFEMLGGMAQMQMYHNEDGTYRLVQRQENWMGELEFNELGTLSFVPPQAPVALSALEGYYEPEDGAVGGINKLYIYASESTDSATVRYEQNGYYSNAEATYNTEKNELSWSNKYCSVTLNLAEDNTIESINVTYGKNKGTYVRKGDAGDVVPEKLPLSENSEYYGATYVVRTPYGSQYFGATGYNTITITGYVKATDTYTVSVSVSGASTTYKLTVSSDKETITLYAEDGTTLVDTLTLFKYVYHDLPTTETEVSLSANDFQKNLVYLFKVKEAGWYTFSGLQDGVRIYYNLNETDPLTDYTYEGTLAGADAVSLTEDSIVGVFMETPAATSFTVAPAETPEGWGDDNPKLLVDNAATVSGITANAVLYFEFTAPAAGGYLIQVYYNDGTNSGDTVISYTVNGKSYSYGYSDTNTFTEISATQANQKFKINVTVSSYIGNKKSVTVVAGDNYAEGATDVTLTGTPADDSLTLSAQIDTGVNYHLTDTHETDVTATADAAFTVKLQGGATVAATESNGKFVAAIPAATEYFTVASETAQKVTLSQTFAHGEIGYPIEASATEGSNTLTIEQSETVYFTLPAGEYSIAASTAQNVTLGKGNTTLTFGAVFTVEEGDVLSCVNYNRGDGSTVTLTIAEAVAVFTDDQVGTFKGSIKGTYAQMSITLTFDLYGNGTFVVQDAPMPANSFDITIVAGENETYSFTYHDESGWDPVDVTVSFTFKSGNLQVTSAQLNDGTAFDLTKQVVVSAVTYTGVIGEGNDATSVVIIITGDQVHYEIDLGSGLETEAASASLVNNNGTYTFTSDFGDTHTFTMSEDGNTITFTDGYREKTGTLTKQA